MIFFPNNSHLSEIIKVTKKCSINKKSKYTYLSPSSSFCLKRNGKVEINNVFKTMVLTITLLRLYDDKNIKYFLPIYNSLCLCE